MTGFGLNENKRLLKMEMWQRALTTKHSWLFATLYKMYYFILSAAEQYD